jgi:nitronate monooxygenase
MYADFAYIGSRRLASKESNVSEAYRDAILESTAVDVAYTGRLTGVDGNYLKKSVVPPGSGGYIFTPDKVERRQASR